MYTNTNQRERERKRDVSLSFSSWATRVRLFRLIESNSPIFHSTRLESFRDFVDSRTSPIRSTSNVLSKKRRRRGGAFHFLLFNLRGEMNKSDTEGDRGPSLVLLQTSFILLGLMQIYNLGLTSVLIFTIVIHRRLRTIPNLLTSNSSAAIFFYSSVFIGQIIVSQQSDQNRREDLCIFLSYSTVSAAGAICYSYLVTATSQLFFNVLFRRRYLLTFSMHWLIIALSWIVSALLPLTLYLSGECPEVIRRERRRIFRVVAIFRGDADVCCSDFDSMDSLAVHGFSVGYSLDRNHHHLCLHRPTHSSCSEHDCSTCQC